jgi:hypothetical protein
MENKKKTLVGAELLDVRPRYVLPLATRVDTTQWTLELFELVESKRELHPLVERLYGEIVEYLVARRCTTSTIGKFYRMVTLVANAQQKVETGRRSHRWDKYSMVLAMKWLKRICALHHRWLAELLFFATSDSYSHGCATKPYRTREGITSDVLFSLAGELWNLYESSNPPAPVRTFERGTLEYQVMLHANNPLLKDVDRANIRAAAIEASGGTPITFHRLREDNQGREYGHIQNVTKEGKRVLFSDTGWVDLDIENCHPTLGDWLSKSLIATMAEYVRDRIGFVAQAGDLDFETAKTDILAVLNGRRRPRTASGMAFLLIMPEFRARLAEEGWGTKRELTKKGAIFRIFETIEGRVIDSIKSEVAAMGKKWHVPMFDGIICDGMGEAEIARLEARVLEDTGVAIKLKIKETY